MIQDSFKKEFETLRELGTETFVLRGSGIIVEILPREEVRTAGGLIIETPSDHVRGQSVTAHRVDVARVLMTGPGYWQDVAGDGDEDTDSVYEPLEVQPGAIVLLPQYQAQLISHFPGIQRPTQNKLALIKMDNIVAYYPNEEAYNLAKSKLNG